MAMRYVANVYCPKEASSKCGLNTAKELLTYHCVYQGNLVTIAMKYSSIYYEGTGTLFYMMEQFDRNNS